MLSVFYFVVRNRMMPAGRQGRKRLEVTPNIPCLPAGRHHSIIPLFQSSKNIILALKP